MRLITNDDDEELHKIIRKLEAIMKSTNDSSQHIGASMKTLPGTLATAVDDALFDRVQSIGKDIGEAMSKELGTYTDMLESASESIAMHRRYAHDIHAIAEYRGDGTGVGNAVMSNDLPW